MCVFDNRVIWRKEVVDGEQCGIWHYGKYAGENMGYKLKCHFQYQLLLILKVNMIRSQDVHSPVSKGKEKKRFHF